MDKLVSDENAYQILRGTLTTKYRNQLEKLVKRGAKKGILNKKGEKYLAPSSRRVHMLYSLLEKHKEREHSPGWPIVDSIGSINKEYIDGISQPTV